MCLALRVCALLALCIAASGARSVALPVITSVDVSVPGTVVLRGRDFGAACPECEVLCDYGKGLRYALPLILWQAREIRARLPDFNAGEFVQLRVRSAVGTSAPVAAAVLPRITAPASRAEAPHRFEHTSLDKMGATGLQQYDISVASPSCDRPAAVFDHARVVVVRQRFGAAQVIATPPRGCARCDPIQVRWYHEPTGYLVFQLHVYRRWIEEPCASRRR